MNEKTQLIQRINELAAAQTGLIEALLACYGEQLREAAQTQHCDDPFNDPLPF